MLDDLWKIFHDELSDLLARDDLSVTDFMEPLDVVSPPAEIFQVIVFGARIGTQDCSVPR